jgi:hypothetical protein
VVLDVDVPLVPACVVSFDDRAGCGVNVWRRDGENPFVEVQFVTYDGGCESHSLTPGQAEQMRAVLDALTRTDGQPEPDVGWVAVRDEADDPEAPEDADSQQDAETPPDDWATQPEG